MVSLLLGVCHGTICTFKKYDQGLVIIKRCELDNMFILLGGMTWDNVLSLLGVCDVIICTF